MAFLNDIVEFSNKFLDLHSFSDFGPMGLQHEGQDWIDTIACSVSISKDVIERAHLEGAQLLLVHHGMFWNNESRVLDERIGGRLELLEKYNISVLAYHLALDAHETIGNNYLAAKALGLSKLQKFTEIGYGGEYVREIVTPAFSHRVRQQFGNENCIELYRQKEVKRVAVIVGDAPQYVVEAHREGYDTFFTGEAAENTIYIASDLGMNFFAAGHDATERSGVRQFGKILNRKFRTKGVFLPVENPV